MKVPITKVVFHVSEQHIQSLMSTHKLRLHHVCEFIKADSVQYSESSKGYVCVRKVPLTHLNFTCVVTSPWADDVQQSFPWLN